MKVMICGSMTFSREMLEAKKKLEEQGHEAIVSCDVEDHVNDDGLIDDLEADFKHCLETDVMRESMNDIEKADAVLFLNLKKNGVEGYVGTSSMMEMGLAYFLNKKIFILNPTPTPSEVRWAHEVRIMQPTVINGDYSKVN